MGKWLTFAVHYTEQIKKWNTQKQKQKTNQFFSKIYKISKKQ